MNTDHSGNNSQVLCVEFMCTIEAILSLLQLYIKRYIIIILHNKTLSGLP